VYVSLDPDSGKTPTPTPTPDPVVTETENLITVTELVRHGARAPMLNNDGFNVGKEQLTPMGMRQRYLLGRYNNHLYEQKLGMSKIE